MASNGEDVGNNAMDIEDVEPNIDDITRESGFTVIGEVKSTRLKPAKIALPKWMSDSQVFNKDISSGSKPIENVSKFLSQRMMDKLEAAGVSSLFPVQAKVIPYLCRTLKSSYIICPPDVCVTAPTGSGKTLTFVLPIIEHLLSKVKSKIRVMVVVPVGHLAEQIKNVFDLYTKDTGLKTGCATGIRTLQADINAMTRKSDDGTIKTDIDILVCTPGRLVDLIYNFEELDLSHLELLVLDEADRMESNEMEHDWLSLIEETVDGSKIQSTCACDTETGGRLVLRANCACSTINYSISKKPIQKWLFSATLTSDPMKLQSMNLYKPRLFRSVEISDLKDDDAHANKSFTPTELSERMVITDQDEKPLFIWYMISKLKYRKVLCFTGSVRNTRSLSMLLEQIEGVTCHEMSSEIVPKDREKILKKFADGQIDVIVCSDLMARGIDISGVNYVINYDPPSNDVTYIHRIGRTARAGKSGIAITLVTKQQAKDFRITVWNAHKLPLESPFPVEVMPLKKVVVHNSKKEYETALAKLPNKMKKGTGRRKFRKKK